MISTARISVPHHLRLPSIAGLVVDAFRAGSFPPYKDIKDELARMVMDPRVALIIGMEDGRFDALSLSSLPTSRLIMLPQVGHLFNRGSPALRKAIIAATVAFIEENGYKQFWALNMTGKSDKAWTKVMQPEGWNAARRGSVMEFNKNE